MALYSYLLFASGVVLFAIGLAKLSKLGQRRTGYPPGPPTLPVIGNMLQIPKRYPHIQMQKWAQEYGPIYCIMIGEMPMIVLSSDQTIKDLLDKRSSIYSSRPDSYIGEALISGKLRQPLMKYGKTWRMVRKMFHTALNVNVVDAYVPYQELESKQMLVEFIKTPNRFYELIRRYSYSFSLQMAYGERAPSLDDPKFKQLFENFTNFVGEISIGSSVLLDAYPVLQRLPDFLLPAVAYAKKLHTLELGLFMSHWIKAKDAFVRKTLKPCIAVDIARTQETEKFSDDIACYAAGIIVEASSDTTSNTLIGFVQAMLLHPDAQKKGQEELDRVVGKERLPELEDMPNLPHVRGFIKEALRWMPTTPSALPHCLIQEDEYMGYLIPAGATIIPNAWAINMDPNRYPDPDRFDPSRYLDDDLNAVESAALADISKRDHFTFGAGRRFCQGSHVAERSMFLFISRMLWGFDFKKVKDSDGNKITPDRTNWHEGLLIFPEVFPADIVPRSPEREKLILKEWDEATQLLDENMQWKATPKGLKARFYVDGKPSG